MRFGGAQIKKVDANKDRVTFKDVAGIEDAKEEVTEIVEFLKHPAKFYKIGASIS